MIPCQLCAKARQPAKLRECCLCRRQCCSACVLWRRVVPVEGGQHRWVGNLCQACQAVEPPFRAKLEMVYRQVLTQEQALLELWRRASLAPLGEEEQP